MFDWLFGFDAPPASQLLAQQQLRDEQYVEAHRRAYMQAYMDRQKARGEIIDVEARFVEEPLQITSEVQE